MITPNVADSGVEDGDPSQDVVAASVVFLVDGKLVLLQPTTTDSGDPKYDMRVIAHNVEYYVLMRDQLSNTLSQGEIPSMASPLSSELHFGQADQGLTDSLWIFNGIDMHVWLDVQDVLSSAALESAKGLSSSIKVSVDFYPLSILISKGILLGIESELVQRRDVNFALFRLALRVSDFSSTCAFDTLTLADTSFPTSPPTPSLGALRLPCSATSGLLLQTSLVLSTRT